MKFFLLCTLCLYAFTGGAQTKILCLGNSITQGNKDHYSYRYYLWEKLIDANADFDFVGSLTANYGGNPAWPAYKGKAFDSDHEGHWGWSIAQALNGNEDQKQVGKLADWIKRYTPDVVLLHFGTNDMFRNHPLPQTLDNLRTVVSMLRGRNPKVTILLAKLVPAYDQVVGLQAAANINSYNAAIPGLVEELNTQQSRVVLVDQFTGFDPAPGKDTYDGVHPSTSGEMKMAAKWFAALQPFVKTGTVTGLEPSNTAEQAMVVYPTLADQRHITVEVKGLAPHEALRLEIYAREGKLLQQQEVRVNHTGTFTQKLLLSVAYSSGVYFVRAISSKRVQTKKFIIAP